MGKTSTGLPIPVGTDKVVDGDDQIAALGNGVDAQWRRGEYLPTTNAQGGFVWPFSPPFAAAPVCSFTDGDATGGTCLRFGIYRAGSSGAGVAVQVFDLNGAPVVNSTIRVQGMFWCAT